jgi:hypothetical protein
MGREARANNTRKNQQQAEAARNHLDQIRLGHLASEIKSRSELRRKLAAVEDPELRDAVYAKLRPYLRFTLRARATRLLRRFGFKVY